MPYNATYTASDVGVASIDTLVGIIYLFQIMAIIIALGLIFIYLFKKL